MMFKAYEEDLVLFKTAFYLDFVLLQHICGIEFEPLRVMNLYV